MCRSLSELSGEANGRDPTEIPVVEDDAMGEEVNFPSGDEREKSGDELGSLKNLDNLDKANSADLQEDLVQGHQPESRISCKNAEFAFTDVRFRHYQRAEYAFTDVRFRQYQHGQVSNPIFSGSDPERKVTGTPMSGQGGETRSS